MKIFVSTRGDSSVGLKGDSILIDWNGNTDDLTNIHGDLESARSVIRESFMEILGDGSVRVEFDCDNVE